LEGILALHRRIEGGVLADRKVDATGLRCPQPILKLTLLVPEMQPGDTLELRADCESFEEDVRKWCERMNKTLLALNTEGEVLIALIKF
jgi:tRNA 2-thiouridine synthesizing protein A